MSGLSDAREQAIEFVAQMLNDHGPGNPRAELWHEMLESSKSYWRAKATIAVDALLAASQDDGSPLVLLAPEQVGALVRTKRESAWFAWPHQLEALGIADRRSSRPVYVGAPDDLQAPPWDDPVPVFTARKESP